MQAKVYVLTGRCGFDMLGTSVSGELEKLQKEMQAAYESALKDLDGNYEDEESGTACGELEATIVTSGDWYEWVISTHTIDIDGTTNFSLPNGVIIAAKLNGDVPDELHGEWNSIDITATHRNGSVDTLCAVEWEAGHGVMAHIYEPVDTEDPLYTKRYMALDAGGLREIDKQELATKICCLPDNHVISFYADKDENGGVDKYGAKMVYAFEATHVILNYYGGSSPYLVDLTIAEDNVLELMDALSKYFEHCGIEAPVYYDDNSGEGCY